MRALLDLVRENEAALEPVLRLSFLQNAIFYLKILDPEHGDEVLIKSVSAELAR